ncbi:MAG TPA: hypothetical protein VH062_25440 [Polyangiaceae bacterium]|jgi:hypothetical protein|nr:hypothetical protein [Polyangiaceae bacterium]
MLDAKQKEKRLKSLEDDFAVLKARMPYTNIRNFVRAMAARLYEIASDPSVGVLIENGTKLAGLLGGSSEHK